MNERFSEATAQANSAATPPARSAANIPPAEPGETLEQVRARYLREVLELALKGARQAVWDWRATSGTIRFDATCSDILAGPRQSGEWASSELLARVHPQDRAQVCAQANALREGGRSETSLEFRMRAHGDAWRWVLASAKVVARDAAGRAAHVVGTMADSDLRKHGEEQLYRMANFDALTGLPNRTLLEDRLNRALADAKRGARTLALMFVNLDRFRNVNDSLGHPVGDHVLRAIAARLTGLVSEADTIARLASDEFAIVLPDCGETAQVARLAATLRRLIEAPLAAGGRVLHLGVSVGIGLYPFDAKDRRSLMRNASAAMHHAKETGGGYQFYSASMNEAAVRRLGLESDLRRALAGGEFELHYQPRVSLASGKVAGVEALLRWNRPGQDRLSPEEFIPLSEETGLIVGIGEWALREACRQAAEWRERHSDLRVAVNLSARQLRSADVHGLVRDVVSSSGIDPRALELEITESALLERTDDTLRTLDRIAELGVRFTIDDFGTGYSNLGCLRRMPLAAIKIDQSFVQGSANDAGDVAIMRAMVGIAQSMDLQVVAEGVETSGQLDTVRSLGCGEAQGYYFSAPLDSRRASEYLRLAA